MNPVLGLADILRLEQLETVHGKERFEGPSAFVPDGRIFGGQALAQCVAAAASTVDPSRAIHSIHGHFLSAGNVRFPVTLGVERIRDGRSFSVRRVTALQDDRAIFSALASFQSAADVPTHQHAIPPDLPAPSELTAISPYRDPTPTDLVAAEELVEIRPARVDLHGGVATTASWVRIRESVTDWAHHDAAAALRSW